MSLPLYDFRGPRVWPRSITVSDGSNSGLGKSTTNTRWVKIVWINYISTYLMPFSEVFLSLFFRVFITEVILLTQATLSWSRELLRVHKPTFIGGDGTILGKKFLQNSLSTTGNSKTSTNALANGFWKKNTNYRLKKVFTRLLKIKCYIMHFVAQNVDGINGIHICWSHLKLAWSGGIPCEMSRLRTWKYF